MIRESETSISNLSVGSESTFVSYDGEDKRMELRISELGFYRGAQVGVIKRGWNYIVQVGESRYAIRENITRDLRVCLNEQ